ncbi:MAG: deoxyribose-phosphate aldolase [bacterium]
MNEDILKDLNLRFDYAALKSNVTEKDIIKICQEAVDHKFFSIAINPTWVSAAKELLHNTGVKILSVSGFPLGANTTDIKIKEAVLGVNDGAHEIDMVANIGWLTANNFKLVENEIIGLRNALPFNVILKVIIEAGMLNNTQMIDATKAVINGGAQFVKTSTGFFGGATLEQVKILYKAAGGQIEVKASGGITSLEQCRAFISAGASRLGSSSSVSIMKELKNCINK